MTNSADPDQSASDEVDRSGSTPVCKGRAYPDSTGPGLNTFDAFFFQQNIDHYYFYLKCKTMFYDSI